MFAAGYAPGALEALGEHSPWLYGPISTATWAAFSAIAYLVIRRHGDQSLSRAPNPHYRCNELRILCTTIDGSVCANRDEKTILPPSLRALRSQSRRGSPH